MPDERQYLEFALAVCREAGNILCDARERRGVTVDAKSGFEIVTNVDIAVDRHFRRRIAAEFSDHAMLSEESGGDDHSETSPCWIVDPLDGTANFVHGHDHVAVSAALSLHGQVVLGVVHAPFAEQTFWAIRGEGAYRNGQSIKASSLTDIRRLAAPALDICWVADGRLTGFIDRIHLWDVAAAGLIATEAGACLTTFGPSHKDAPSDGVDYVIAAPGIFDRLCDAIVDRCGV